MTVALDGDDGVGIGHWGWLPLLTGLVVAQIVRDLRIDAGLKWPNDVLVGDGTLALAHHCVQQVNDLLLAGGGGIEPPPHLHESLIHLLELAVDVVT